MWDIILSKEISKWMEILDSESNTAILKTVYILSEIGPNLGRPYVDSVKTSHYRNMKELRIQNKKHVYRIFFIFDSKRKAVLLIGGDKRGDKRFYNKMIPIADKIFEKYKAGEN